VAQDVQEQLRNDWSSEEDEAELEKEQRGSEEVDQGGDELAPMTRGRSSPAVAAKKSGRRSSLETVSVIYDSLINHQADRKNTMKQIQIATETFKMISAHSDVDHPLCEECPEAVLDIYDQEIKEMEKAKAHYDQMGHRLQQEVEQHHAESSELDTELEELKRTEEELKARLMKTEDQRMKIAEERKAQEKREAKLKEEEQAYWKEFNQHQQKMLQLKDDQMSVQFQLHYTTEQLNRLKKTNVLNSAFHIWHNGHFGTINGLRLGRLQTVPVEWAEINAAWGQTAFLLTTLARFTGIEFEHYRLVPYGNQSFLEPLEGKRKLLPLYSSAGLRIFTDSKFDAAMVGFLDCMNQLKLHIEKTSQPHFMLPYNVDKDKIGDVNKEFYSIKTQFNTQERWTKALKFLLTNLRWALTWVAANSIQNSAE
jgi:beclin 1